MVAATSHLMVDRIRFSSNNIYSSVIAYVKFVNSISNPYEAFVRGEGGQKGGREGGRE